MSKRGPKSAAEKAAVVKGDFGKNVETPKPPADLTDSQKEIWKRVVASEPLTFFETAALQDILRQYCQHADAAQELAQIISGFRSEWIRSEEGAKRYDHLLRMRERETSAMIRCATKLRLTNQSRYTPQAAATASKNRASEPKPWEQ